MTKFIVHGILPANEFHACDDYVKANHDSFEEAFFHALYLRYMAEDVTVLHALTGEILFRSEYWGIPELHTLPKRKHQALISKHFCSSAHYWLEAENHMAQKYAKDTGKPQHIFTWAEWCKVIYKIGGQII